MPLTTPAARPNPRHPAFAAVLVGGLLIAATACSSTMGLPDSATSQGDDVTSLWRVFVVLAGIISSLIWVLTAIVIITSLRRRRAEGKDGIPVQHAQRLVLEIFYTGAPLVIVAVLFGLTLRTNGVLADISATPDLRVEVTGFQWQWQFAYPTEHITIAGDPEVLPELWLPVGRNVHFEVQSPDVIHSFWVPNFLEKRDLIPGTPTSFQVTVKAPGQWIGRCAEYCGFNHWQMKFAVCAVPADQFDAWIRETAARPQPVVAGELIDVASGSTTPATGSHRCPSPPASDIGFSQTAAGGGG